jgi:DNA mismatch endonuclease (patch repair protein)
MPKSNRDYWIGKITRNRDRDELNRGLLEAQGWEVGVVWECEIRDQERLSAKLLDFLRR